MIIIRIIFDCQGTHFIRFAQKTRSWGAEQEAEAIGVQELSRLSESFFKPYIEVTKGDHDNF